MTIGSSTVQNPAIPAEIKPCNPMENGTSRPQVWRSETRRRIAQTNLKRCPLCNALNAQANTDCFICGWHGGFDHDPFRIEESLIRLIYQSPDMEILDRAPKPLPGMFDRLMAHFRKHIDYEV